MDMVQLYLLGLKPSPWAQTIVKLQDDLVKNHTNAEIYIISILWS